MKKFIFLFLILFSFPLKLNVNAEEITTNEKVLALDSNGNIMKDGYGFISQTGTDYYFNYQKYDNKIIVDGFGNPSSSYKTKLNNVFPSFMSDPTNLEVVAIYKGIWCQAEVKTKEKIISAKTFSKYTITKLNGYISTNLKLYAGFDTRIDDILYANFYIKGHKETRNFWTSIGFDPKREPYNFDILVKKDKWLNLEHAPSLKNGSAGLASDILELFDEYDRPGIYPNITNFKPELEWVFNIAIIEGAFVPDNLIMVDICYLIDEVIVYTKYIDNEYLGSDETSSIFLKSRKTFLTDLFNGIKNYGKYFLYIILIVASIYLISVLTPIIRNVSNNIKVSRQQRKNNKRE